MQDPFNNYPPGAKNDPRAPWNQHVDEIEAVFRLACESGISGPVGRERFPGDTPQRTINQAAHAWANGQTGHPWDALMVEFDEDSWVLEL